MDDGLNWRRRITRPRDHIELLKKRIHDRHRGEPPQREAAILEEILRIEADTDKQYSGGKTR